MVQAFADESSFQVVLAHGAAGEDRRHPPAAARYSWMSRRVDTAMQRTANRNPMIYGSLTEPRREELIPRHDPMLAGSKRTDLSIDWSTLTTYIGVIVNQPRHRGKDDEQERTCQRPIVTG